MGTEGQYIFTGKNIKPSWKETVGTWGRRTIKNTKQKETVSPNTYL